MERTMHSYDRLERQNFIKENIGFGEHFDSIVWDKGHRNGKEIHTITTTGIICIYNFYTRKFITMLIARPQQIKRYYYGKPFPKGLNEILKLAEEHQRKGWNEI